MSDYFTAIYDLIETMEAEKIKSVDVKYLRWLIKGVHNLGS